MPDRWPTPPHEGPPLPRLIEQVEGGGPQRLRLGQQDIGPAHLRRVGSTGKHRREVTRRVAADRRLVESVERRYASIRGLPHQCGVDQVPVGMAANRALPSHGSTWGRSPLLAVNSFITRATPCSFWTSVHSSFPRVPPFVRWHSGSLGAAFSLVESSVPTGPRGGWRSGLLAEVEESTGKESCHPRSLPVAGSLRRTAATPRSFLAGHGPPR